MAWPQITYIVLLAVNFGCALAMHGKETKFSVFHTSISTAISVFLLAEGGFFG